MSDDDSSEAIGELIGALFAGLVEFAIAAPALIFWLVSFALSLLAVALFSGWL